MKTDDLIRRIDELREAADEAGKDYDHVRYGGSAAVHLPASDFATSLGACLTQLQNELHALSMELRLDPVNR